MDYSVDDGKVVRYTAEEGDHGIITVCSHYGAPVPGTHLGPRKIVERFGGRFRDSSATDVIIPPIDPARGEGDDPSRHDIYNLRLVKAVCERTRDAVLTVDGQGKTPVVFHGDDSTVMGVGWGLKLCTSERVGLVYFDAHPDMNTPDTSPSGCIYGMGVAHLLGLGHPRLLSLYGPGSKVGAFDPESLALIGQRSFDPGEVALMQKHHISLYSPDMLETAGVEEVKRHLRAKYSKLGISHLYVHIDQDVVDPMFSGATLCQTPGGIEPERLCELVSFLHEEFNILGVSFGNYLPSIDGEEKTLEIIGEVLEELEVI